MLTLRFVRSGLFLCGGAIGTLVFVAHSSAATIDYSGRVLNQSNKAISIARIWLPGTGLLAYTDANGSFSLKGESTPSAIIRQPSSSGSHAPFSWASGILTIANPRGQAVSIDLFTPDGRVVASLKSFDRTVAIPSAALKRLGIILARVTIGNSRCFTKFMSVGGRISTIESIMQDDPAGMAKTAATYDLSAAAPGYTTGSFPQSQETASNLTLTLIAQTSDTLGKFQKYWEGLGAITDISTGKVVALPIEKRIHVIIFPEGYTAADLTAGKYETDMASWYAQVFRVDPMGYFREAFVLWKYPVASIAHIIPDGQGDTYFKVRVSSGSIGTKLDSTAATLWRLLIAQFPSPPKNFYPSGGFFGPIARNMTVSFMVFDPQSGRAGYSGVTTSLPNPSNRNQGMAAAFALDQHHEFMHALALLNDEYYDAAYSPLTASSLKQTSASITNVVCCTKCDSLPWKHLLYGGDYNTSADSLVGAFGTNGRYHSELKCLVNGSHDNASLFGGNGNLRSTDRLCNWCRELTAFRIYERAMVLDNTSTSWSTWVSSYRPAFYKVLGFSAPSPVPQKTSDGKAWFMPCQ